MFRKMKKAAGAIAIEAVLSLTIFMLAILALMMGSLLIRTQSAMQYALNQTAKEISGYFYLLDKIGIASVISGNANKSAQANVQQMNDTARHIISFSGGLSDTLGELSETGQQVMSNVEDGTFSEDDINRIKGLKEDTEEFKNEIAVIKNDLMELKKCNKPMMFKGIIQVFGKSLINSAVSKFITPYVCEALMPKYLVNETGKKAKDKDGNDVSLESLFYKNAGIIESSIDFQGSKILEDGRTITLVVSYKVDASKLTLGFYKKELQFHQMASTCAWVRENDSDSLLSLSEVNEFYDPERIEKKAAELNDARHKEEAARQAEEEAKKKLQDELEKHAVDEKDKDDKDKDDKDKDDKDDKSKSDVKLPAGAAPSVEFKAAYDKLTDAQKQEFNWNYTYLLNTYGIDLVEAINNMSDKDAAIQMVLDKAINGGMLLCYYGEDGLKAYSQLDEHSRTLLLYGQIRPNDPRALDLIEMILNEKRTQITADDIDAVIKASKTKDKDKAGKVTLPAGVNGNAAFLKAYDKLTDAQKEQYNQLQASVKNRPPYEYDLTAVLNGCSDKDAVLQFLLQEKHPEDVAWILAVYGESGFEAYQKLDADSRVFLLNGPWRTGSTFDSDLIKLNRELLNLILDENRSKITMNDMAKIQEAADKKTKPEESKKVEQYSKQYGSEFSKLYTQYGSEVVEALDKTTNPDAVVSFIKERGMDAYNNRFQYKKDPRDNPKAVPAMIEDPYAYYGFRPNPECEELKNYADYDWSDPEVAQAARKRRIEYHMENEGIPELVESMRAEGKTTEEIARAANQRRNQNRENSYIKKNDMEGLEAMRARNLEKYGQEFGPTADQLFIKYGNSWEEVIASSTRSSPAMDAICGVYDDYN